MKELQEFAATLHLAMRTLQFYAADHPRTVETMNAFERSVGAILGSEPRVTLLVVKGKLLLQGQQVDMTSTHLKMLAKTLDDRQLSGFIITQGVNSRELMELIRLLLLKPQQLKDEGGGDRVLERAEVIHIRMSRVRYEALTDEEEVVWGKSLQRNERADAPANLRALLMHVSKADASEASEPGAAAELQRLSENVDRDFPAAGTPESDTRIRVILHEALAGLASDVQLSLLLDVPCLPEGRVRDALIPIAREMISGGSTPREGGVRLDADTVSRILQSSPDRDGGIELLRARMADLGISREQLDEVLHVIGWEKLTWKEKIGKLLTDDRMFNFPPEKFLIFIRELLESNQREEVLHLLDRYGRGLQHDSYFIRLNVSDTLGQITRFIAHPGVNAETDHLLGRLLLNHLLREQDARVRNAACEAAANYIAALVATGRANVALNHLTHIQAAVHAAPANTTIRAAHESLIAALGEPKRAVEIVANLSRSDAESYNATAIPLMTHLGSALARAVIEALGNEEDRQLRGRMLKAVKAIGSPAYPHLVSAVNDPTWFVVRNALNILGDIGMAEQVPQIAPKLHHPDDRVRRAAARALGKIGGEAAEEFLVGAIESSDAETQGEILLCLGAMKAQKAVPALLELASARRRADDQLRELALTTLGNIGSTAAVPTLAELVEKKGGLLARESTRIRVAAGRALAAIGTPESRDAIQKAIDSESDAGARSQLQQLLSR